MTRRSHGAFAVLVCGLVSCSAGGHMAAAKAGVERFREQVAQGQFVEMYNEWEPEFTKPSSSDDFVQFMKNAATELGAHQSSKQVEWHVKYGTDGAIVTLGYESVFEKGKAEEKFVFHIKDGTARLAKYHIGSKALVTN